MKQAVADICMPRQVPEVCGCGSEQLKTGQALQRRLPALMDDMLADTTTISKISRTWHKSSCRARAFYVELRGKFVFNRSMALMVTFGRKASGFGSPIRLYSRPFKCCQV